MGILPSLIFYLRRENVRVKTRYNIINQEEILNFIGKLKETRPKHSKYIEKKVLKYLKQDVYIAESKLYPLSIVIKKIFNRASSKEKFIFKKHGLFGAYHFVYLNDALFNRIVATLDYSESNPELNSMPFKELVYDFQERKSTQSHSIELLVNKTDYEVFLTLPKYEVWKLLSLKSYKQEGLLMKNCIGKTLMPVPGIYILSVRPMSQKYSPILTLRIDESLNALLEAKEKVNQDVLRYDHILNSIITKLKIDKHT